VKKIESPYFVIFCEKRKIVRIMKKISCIVFFVKKRREKKEEKSGDNFRDIVIKKGKLINYESYVSSSEYYKSVVKSLPMVFEESVSEADMSNDS
jgi:hypothetical protein